MADMVMDVEKAGRWVASVQAEIAEVNKTLVEVEEVCRTFPGNDDVVFQLIEKTGGMLEDTWNTATAVYKDAWEKVSEGISAVGKAGERVQEFFNDLASKIQ